MDELSAELRKFLQNQPFLELTDGKKVKCTLNGHEFPCNLTELQHFISGNKYKKLSANAEFNYSQYEPHLVPSTKQPNHLFCKLTLRHLNRVPEHVLRHINGKRYKKALGEYEECVKQGVQFVPARLRHKKQRKHTDDGRESASEKQHKPKQKQDSGIWAPSSSDEEGSDSEDSMSDLYPRECPTLQLLKHKNMYAKVDRTLNLMLRSPLKIKKYCSYCRYTCQCSRIPSIVLFLTISAYHTAFFNIILN
uniref:Surfeit 2 n=1 Tax=Astyanax mexicanus TaxID=7994 RepID=A0A3B1J7U2_ASTMX